MGRRSKPRPLAVTTAQSMPPQKKIKKKCLTRIATYARLLSRVTDNMYYVNLAGPAKP